MRFRIRAKQPEYWAVLLPQFVQEVPFPKAAMVEMPQGAEAERTPRATQDWVQVEKGMLSRLLYPNPVCMLSACSGGERSVMVITWLTPINNQGGFVCSVNASRHTASFLNTSGAIFVLNVPVKGMEELVLAVGGCTGGEVDKFDKLSLAACAPGGEALIHVTSSGQTDSIEETSSLTSSSKAKKQKLSKKEIARREVETATQKALALRDCVAHVLCRVETVTEDDGHLLLRCSQLAGWSRREYWDGRNFIPQRGSNAEPYLTFLGSKIFGYVCSAATVPTAASDA